MEDQPLFTRIETVFVVVDDLSSSIQWYVDYLGMTLQWETEHMAVVIVDEQVPVTLVRRASTGNEHPRFNLFAPDIERAHRQLSKSGVEVGPIVDHGNVRTFDFRDESGTLLNAYYYDESG